MRHAQRTGDGQRTVTVLRIVGWNVHEKANVPARSNLNSNESLAFSAGDVNEPSSAVTSCWRASRFVHTTVVPRSTVSGANVSWAIADSTRAGLGGVAVAADGVGVAAGVELAAGLAAGCAGVAVGGAVGVEAGGVDAVGVFAVRVALATAGVAAAGAAAGEPLQPASRVTRAAVPPARLRGRLLRTTHRRIRRWSVCKRSPCPFSAPR